jgi:MSHA biogenesis protein MshJ
MNTSLAQIQEKIDTRNIRERSLIFLCVIAVIFLLWNLVVQSSIDSKQNVLEIQLKDAKAQRETLENQVATIALALATDPNLEQKNHIAQLNTTIADLDTQLGGLSRGLISADDLPRILQEMLATTSSLNLVSVQTLPVDELQLITGESAGDKKTSAGIYKHSVVLRVSGSYFQLVNFLQALETSEWRFYWEQLDYEVENYPDADIVLRVYTLGAEKGRLGV